ncbi:VOC family protein [Gramella sp. BOM4]|nr:VOC family protein [Christiangramia bathymodioli]
MKLGAFSISLSVADIRASKQFYENLGFKVLGGKLEDNYLIMKNENAIIGLFQGMFDNNILTFNPGWDENGQNIDSFDDIRKIQKNLQLAGISIDKKVDPESTGPASFTIKDPDGNLILIDQHR